MKSILFGACAFIILSQHSFAFQDQEHEYEKYLAESRAANAAFDQEKTLHFAEKAWEAIQDVPDSDKVTRDRERTGKQLANCFSKAGRFDEALELLKQTHQSMLRSGNEPAAARIVEAEIQSLEEIVKLDELDQEVLRDENAKFLNAKRSGSMRRQKRACESAMKEYQELLGDNFYETIQFKQYHLMAKASLEWESEDLSDEFKAVEDQLDELLGTPNYMSYLLNRERFKYHIQREELELAKTVGLRTIESADDIEMKFDPYEHGNFLEQMANCFIFLNDRVGARVYLEKALANKVAVLGPEHFETGIIYSRLSLESTFVGDWATARRYSLLADKALATDKTDKRTTEVRLALNRKSLAYIDLRTGNLDKAIFHAGLTVLPFRDASRAFDFMDTIVILAKAEARRGNTDKAKKLIEELTTIYENMDYYRGLEKFKMDIGYLHMEVGEYQKAIENTLEGIKLLKKAKMEVPRFTYRILSLAYAKSGDNENAEIYFNKDFEILMWDYRRNSSRMSETESLAHASEVQFNFQKSLAYVDFEKANAAEILEKVAHTKGIFSRTLVERQSRIRLTNDDTIVQTYVDAGLELDSEIISSEISKKQSSRFVELESRKRTGFDQIAFRWEPLEVETDLPVIEELNESLPEGTAVLEFVVGDKLIGEEVVPSYYCFVIQKLNGTIQVDPVCLGDANEINKMVETWRNEFVIVGQTRGVDRTKAKVKKNMKLGGTLKADLWSPLEEKLVGCKTVVVCPVGYLAKVPWNALPGKVEGESLLHDYLIVKEANVKSVLKTLRNDVPVGNGDFVLAGDVDFGKASEGSNFSWPPLEHTSKELDGIAKLFGANTPFAVMSQTDASEENVLNNLQNARGLHLALHGFAFDNDKPPVVATAKSELFKAQEMDSMAERHPFSITGIVMSGANEKTPEVDPRNDGYVSGEAILAMELQHLDWVVLSACDAGRGKITLGEGTFGIEKAFRLAGARSVIASSWLVHDEYTKEMMILLYENRYNQGMSKAEALRAAQLEMAKKLPPAFWASWSISGEW